MAQLRASGPNVALKSDNAANLAARLKGSAANGQMDELLKLRSESELLRSQTRRLDAFREENDR